MSDTFTLITDSYCVYSVKVRIALDLKSLGFKEEAPVDGSYESTGFQKVFPAGSVPVIRCGDFELHDSSAIVEYLEETYPHPALFPKDVHDKARIRSVANYHDSRLEPLLAKLNRTLMQSDSPERQETIDLTRDRIFDRLFRLNKLLQDAKVNDSSGIDLLNLVYPATLMQIQYTLEHLDKALVIPDHLKTFLSTSLNHEIIAARVQQHMAQVTKRLEKWLPVERVLS